VKLFNFTSNARLSATHGRVPVDGPASGVNWVESAEMGHPFVQRGSLHSVSVVTALYIVYGYLFPCNLPRLTPFGWDYRSPASGQCRIFSSTGRQPSESSASTQRCFCPFERSSSPAKQRQTRVTFCLRRSSWISLGRPKYGCLAFKGQSKYGETSRSVADKRHP
jgi:hypothetical protein